MLCRQVTFWRNKSLQTYLAIAIGNAVKEGKKVVAVLVAELGDDAGVQEHQLKIPIGRLPHLGWMPGMAPK